MFGVVVGALLVALVAGLMVWGTAGDELVALRPQRLSIDLPEGTVLPAGLGTNVAISPDGQSLAYVAPGAGGLLQLYLRPLDEFGATPIPGTEGAIEPFFSPDGEWIAFWSQVGNRLSRIPRSGGEPFLLCEQCSHGFWGDDDSILFARNGALWRMPGTGGTAELLVGPMPDRGVPALDRPVLLPGGQAVLFEIGLLGFGGIGVLSLDTGEYVQVSDNGANPLYSPTGHILFARGSTLFGVPFDAEELTVTGPVVPVVQGVRVENGGALQARVSPNGLLVYVPASEATGTRLVWVDRDGGVVDSVFDEPRVFNAPRLSPTGEQIAVQINDEGNNDIWIHNVEARNTLKLTTTGDATNPVWSPDGSQVAFGSGSAGSFAIQSIAGTGEQKVVLPRGSYLRYSPTGHLLYVVQSDEVLGDLWAIGFDLNRLETVGDPVPVQEGVLAHSQGGANFSLSENGSLIYTPAVWAGSQLKTLEWVDREGNEEPSALLPGIYSTPRLSPDGTRVAVHAPGGIWVHDLASGRGTNLTRTGIVPVWAPDGERIGFGDSEIGTFGVSWALATGTGQAELVVSGSDRELWARSWTPDGRSLLVDTRSGIGVVSLDNDGTVQPLVEEDFVVRFPALSPDGKWMAYSSWETGSPEIYVRPFPEVDVDQRRISLDGGVHPAWSSEGRELFYLAGEAVMGVTVETEPTFVAGLPEVRVDGDYQYSNDGNRAWDISRDGQRFLMMKRIKDESSDINVVLNWFDELQRLVPTP